MIIELLGYAGAPVVVLYLANRTIDVVYLLTNRDDRRGISAVRQVGGGFDRRWCRNCHHVLAVRRDDGYTYGHQLGNCGAPQDIVAYDEEEATRPRLSAADFPHLSDIAEAEDLVAELVEASPEIDWDPEDIEFLREQMKNARVVR
jgi:hypothetical protein